MKIYQNSFIQTPLSVEFTLLSKPVDQAPINLHLCLKYKRGSKVERRKCSRALFGYSHLMSFDVPSDPLSLAIISGNMNTISWDGKLTMQALVVMTFGEGIPLNH